MAAEGTTLREFYSSPYQAVVMNFVCKRAWRPLSAVLRWVCPILRLRPWARRLLGFGKGNERYVIVTRYDDVEEVLTNDMDFRVPYEVVDEPLSCDPPFVLALDREEEDLGGGDYCKESSDGSDYCRGIAEIHKFFPDDDKEPPYAYGLGSDLKDVRDWSAAYATSQLDQGLVHNGHRRLDVIGGLLRRVPTRIVERYYGIPIGLGSKDAEDAEERYRRFEDNHFAVSGYMFGPPGSSTDREQELVRKAAEYVRESLDRAIDLAIQERDAPGRPSSRQDLLYRMVSSGTLSRAKIRSHLWGMVAGFLPTNTLASGNILDVLLKRGSVFAAALDAAKQDKDELLRGFLFEALRFRPSPPLGVWRQYISRKDGGTEDRDGYVLADGRFRARTLSLLRKKLIRNRDYVLASTESAMFDARRMHRPRRFIADRSRAEYMYFGYGVHQCIGKAIAEQQITQTLKALLRREPRPLSGIKLKRLGYFPHEWMMEYTA